MRARPLLPGIFFLGITATVTFPPIAPNGENVMMREAVLSSHAMVYFFLPKTHVFSTAALPITSGALAALNLRRTKCPEVSLPTNDRSLSCDTHTLTPSV